MGILSRYTGFEDGLNDDLGEGGAGEGGEGTPAVLAEATAQVAEAQVNLEQMAAQIEEVRVNVEQVDEAVVEIASNIDGMESLIQSGNYNSKAFSNLYNRSVTLNTILGGRSINRSGMESLSDAGTAQIMARDGMESFMDQVKSYAKKAADAIRTIFNIIINFFVGLVSSTAALGRRQEQVAKRLTDSTKLKEKIKLGNWNVLFDYEKNGLDEGLEGWGLTNSAIRKLADVGKDANKVSLGEFNSAYATLASAITGETKKEASDTKETSKEESKVLIGRNVGIRVYAEIGTASAKDLADAAVLARKIKINFSIDPEVSKKLKSGEVAAKADKAKLKSAVDEVKSIVSGLRSSKVEDGFTTAVRDKVIGSLNVLKADDAEQTKEVNEKTALVRAIYSSTSSIAQSINKHIINCANWTLDGVQAHL